MKTVLLTFLLFLSTHLRADVEYNKNTFLGEIISEVLDQLPPDYLGKVKTPILIEEKKIPSDEYFSGDNLCQIKSGVKFGFTLRNKITISSRLVTLAQKNLNQFKCGHHTFKNHLKAVVIHELTHVKDNAEKISLSPDYQRIIGTKRIHSSSKKKPLHQNSLTSPDSYEFKNIEESLAVNVEYLILDPDFQCRRPAMARFLAGKLGLSLNNECSKNQKIILQSAFMEDSYQKVVDLAPKNIYQIHYLFAGKGRAMMSRWGHAMFRLVICAPFRKIPGPECMQDVSHHIVLSYRAYINEQSINYSKGIFGGYPSQMFAFRFLEVQQEYTKYELRDLYSVPLRMTTQEKRDFIELSLERYWSYQSKYYFLNNNCATETMRHLGVVFDEDQTKKVSSFSPVNIYNDLIKDKNGLIDEKWQSLSREDLISKGNLSVSQYHELEKTYLFLKDYFQSYKAKSFTHFLNNSLPEDRKNDYLNSHQRLSEINLELRKKIVLRLVFMERYLAFRFFQKFQNKVLKMMNKNERFKNEFQLKAEELKILTLQPWQIIKTNYGVPLQDEFENQFATFNDKQKLKIGLGIEEQLIKFETILGKKYFESEFFQLQALKDVKDYQTKVMNELFN
jgi:Domain of unknown function (DUF4105)